MTKDILNAAHRLTVETIKSLPPAGTPAPTAWFLGPKAENRVFLAKLVKQAVAAHSDFRVDYAPKDPPFATKEAMCVFRGDPATRTDGIRPPIPI